MDIINEAQEEALMDSINKYLRSLTPEQKKEWKDEMDKNYIGERFTGKLVERKKLIENLSKDGIPISDICQLKVGETYFMIECNLNLYETDSSVMYGTVPYTKDGFMEDKYLIHHKSYDDLLAYLRKVIECGQAIPNQNE